MGSIAAAPSSQCHLLKKWPLTHGRWGMAGTEAKVCLRIQSYLFFLRFLALTSTPNLLLKSPERTVRKNNRRNRANTETSGELKVKGLLHLQLESFRSGLREGGNRLAIWKWACRWLVWPRISMFLASFELSTFIWRHLVPSREFNVNKLSPFQVLYLLFPDTYYIHKISVQWQYWPACTVISVTSIRISPNSQSNWQNIVNSNFGVHTLLSLHYIAPIMAWLTATTTLEPSLTLCLFTSF